MGNLIRTTIDEVDGLPEELDLKADKSTTVTGAGLLDGQGGDLGSDRVFTLEEVSDAEIIAGVDNGKVVTARRYHSQLGRFLSISDSFFSTGPNWPANGNLYAQGDSQTYGTNAASAGGRLAESERWPNQLAAYCGGLAVTNLGRPGEKISAQGGGTTQNIWNSFGSVPWNWAGVGAAMLGYNNCDANTITHSYYDNMQAAFVAFLARYLIDDYAGLGTAGWGHTGNAGGTIDGFTTTGSSADTGVTAGESAARNPFYYGDANGAFKRITLTTNQYVEFTVTDKKAVALFLYAKPSGGTYVVTVNGDQWASGTTDYTGIGGNDPSDHWYPRAVWLDNLPSSAVIRLTATGSVTWMAYGWIPNTGALTSNKVIVLAGPTGNQANGRGDRMLTELNYRAQAAVSKFREYPVYYADPWTGWRRGRFDEPSDISHFNADGAKHVADAFFRAGKIGRSVVMDEPITMRRVAEYLDGIRIVNLDPAVWTATVTNGGLLNGNVNANLTVRCSNTANSTVLARHNAGGSMKTLLRACDRHSSTRNSSFIDWSLPFRISLTIDLSSNTANGSGYIYFGRPYNNTTISALALKGWGLVFESNSLKAQVHDGSSLTTSDSLLTIGTDKYYRVAVENDGNGTFRFYVNDALAWTTALGPVGNGNGLATGIELAATNGGDAAFYIFSIGDIKINDIPIWERFL